MLDGRSNSAARPAMTAAPRLTLGALYHAMRAGIGDAGPARVSMEFQQRSSLAPIVNGRRADPEALGKQVFTAELDYDDSAVQRAAIYLGDAASPSESRFSLERHGQGYAYSIDGESWGRFAARPQIFDLTEFERELELVPVRDVTIEQAMEARHLNEALDIDLDADAFARLLRIFAADRDEDVDNLDLSAFSVSIAGGEDVSMLYWWSLTGFEPAESVEPGVETYASKVTCSVSIRLSRLDAVERRKIKLDKRLPEVAHVDDVWALLREGGGGSSADEQAG